MQIKKEDENEESSSVHIIKSGFSKHNNMFYKDLPLTSSPLFSPFTDSAIRVKSKRNPNAFMFGLKLFFELFI